MDNVGAAIANYRLYLETFVHDRRSCKHVHPPITKHDDNCLYCKKYGNIFANGIICDKRPDLNTYIVPLQNKLTEDSGDEH